MPDDEVDLKLPEDQLEIMRQISMKLTGRSNLSKVKILPGLVGFEDGSGSVASHFGGKPLRSVEGVVAAV